MAERRNGEVEMIKALKGHVVIENIDDTVQTPSGMIIIPGTHKEKNMKGVVTDSAIKDIKVGDTIIFGRYHGKDIPFEDKTYRAINGEDIMAIEKDGVIYPVSDWLLCSMIEEDEKIGSIIIPKKEKEADGFNKAKVIKLGPGRIFKNGETCKMTVVEGDQILFGPYCSFALKAWGKNLLMVRETSCEAILGGA